MNEDAQRTLGACLAEDNCCRFRVWAPEASRVELQIIEPEQRSYPMLRQQKGYWQIELYDLVPGTLYGYRLDDSDFRPDPASTRQPSGVHGPSAVTSEAFDWHDSHWKGLSLDQYVLYELHVGAFTPGGTFDAVIPRLLELKDLGVTAVELMPVAQFPGTRNWGYDGVYPFAPQESYGGPEGLRRLIDACHCLEMGVVLDVVYNHLGPEGNYLPSFAPYFTDRYKTPWGLALNFDGPGSDEVRRFFIENAVYWIRDFHFDALRLDAVHAIFDWSAVPFLQELGDAVHAVGKTLDRRVHVIAESSLNDSRLVRPVALGGYGLDAQWSDDFHHSLRVLLTGDNQGYYEDFGELNQLAKAFAEGFVYSGQYSSYRRRRHGNSSRDLPGRQFVVCSQNHDQVGNRRLGDRLSTTLTLDGLKLAAGAVLLSPFIPLLFMGEEYGERAPFQYFVSHGDPGLIEAVREGRRREFAAFDWQGDVPDPQDEHTFEQSRLDWEIRFEGEHRALRDYYRELLRLRRSHPALALLSKQHLDVESDSVGRTIVLRRRCDTEEVCVMMNFGDDTARMQLPPGCWIPLLDSGASRWLGPGSAVEDTGKTVGPRQVSLGPRRLILFARKEA